MKKSKKRLPKYDIGKRPINLGYQTNKGIGTQVSSTPGYNLYTDVNAMKSNTVPNILGNILKNAQYPLMALLAMTPVVTAAGLNMINTGNAMTLMGIATGNQSTAMGGQALKNIGQLSTKLSTTAASNIASAIGTAYGLYNVGSDIANEGDTISTGQIASSRGVNQYTTERGNSYTEKTGPDGGAAMEYEKQAAAQKKTGLILDSMGLGASIGGFFGPVGMGIGALGGTLVGGLASLLGFGDNEDAVNDRLNLVADVTGMENRLSKTLADNLDARAAFASGAADGKLPGVKLGKGVANLSGGEVVLLGDLRVRVPGKKNNKDEYTAKKGTLIGEMVDHPASKVWTNKEGISDYIWHGGDENIAMAAMKKILAKETMKKILKEHYKKGKLPAYENGLSDILLTSLPRIPELALLYKNIAEDRNADISAPNTYIANTKGDDAINQLQRLSFDIEPYKKAALDLRKQRQWNRRRNYAGSGGSIYLADLADYMQELNSLRDIHATLENENNKLKSLAANAQLLKSITDQLIANQAAIDQENRRLLAYGAKFTATRSDMAQLGSLFPTMAKDLFDVFKTRTANDFKDRMIKMYGQQIDNDTVRLWHDLNNNSNKVASSPVYTGPNYMFGNNKGYSIFTPKSLIDYYNNPLGVSYDRSNPFGISSFNFKIR